MVTLEQIKELAKQFHHEVVEMRRHLHANPELSMEEYKTSSYIKTQLAKMGIESIADMAGTGVVAEISGKDPDRKMVALRADMDALPIIEESDKSYKSLVKGVMHACGHDAHMAGLLGAAKILHALRHHFNGSVRLIFQPSEESYQGGASQMIEEGVLENPRPVAVFGQHVLPEFPEGKVGVRGGNYMASTDEIYLTVKGKGGHAATPHQVIDPILIAAHIIVALQQIVSRRAKPFMPSVLSFGHIMGKGRTNVIPDKVTIDGTFRTFDEDWRAEAHHLIGKMAETIARSMGGDCEVKINKGYPFLVNDENLSGKFRKWAGEYLGSDNVKEIDLTMGSEDFAYFSQITPSLFYRLGTANEAKGIVSNLHTSTFDIDEDALQTGMGLMAYLAVKQLEE
ncbi:MAG TPA: M20 family metallopeptidase [Bacteroidales bacterium]|nr:M20 family metallopeptidase [Bacteroidales bacterium]